ncbi:repeat outer membrane protein [Anaeramoeba ignava]|uniref:Repeat outer membrane protein n=1 Tax=Anaeramoeba ignava TaxID=1746090 RepID=A0A9Q0LSM4_ANAIG|nr:repeat outer membrane protein [Anaeramoeba ignava]
MFYSRLSLLCSRFRREWFFWELIVMARKALFVFALLYFNFASDLQIRLLILVLLIAIILQVAFEPYDTQGRNRAEMILLCVLEIVMISSFVFVSDESGDTKAKERIETFVLILIWMAIIVIFFVLINEIVERVKYKKEKRKIKKRNRERDLLEVLKESEFIVFLDEKPSFDLIVQWIGTLSKKESSKFANFISQFDDLIQKNSIQFPEQNYLDNWRELIQNDLKNWYEQRATIKEKLMFSSLINSLFMYLVEKGDNPIQRWRSNTQNIIPLSQNENSN